MERKPQFTVKDLFVTPFTKQRRYHEDGTAEFVDIPDTQIHTGLDVFDEMITLLRSGKCSVDKLVKELGVEQKDLNGLMRLLTGLNLAEFVAEWQLLTVDELLRYTNMSMTKVAEFCGMGNGVNLSRKVSRAYKYPPVSRRQKLRKKNDLGRYRFG